MFAGFQIISAQEPSKSESDRDAVSLRLNSKENVFSVGEKIRLKLVLRNEGKRPLAIVEPFDWIHMKRIKVLSEDGAPIPFSSEGQKRSKQPGVGSRRSELIAAGGKFEYFLDLCLVYDLPQGKYEIVTWRYFFWKDDLKQAKVESRPIRIIIE